MQEAPLEWKLTKSVQMLLTSISSGHNAFVSLSSEEALANLIPLSSFVHS